MTTYVHSLTRLSSDADASISGRFGFHATELTSRVCACRHNAAINENWDSFGLACHIQFLLWPRGQTKAHSLHQLMQMDPRNSICDKWQESRMQKQFTCWNTRIALSPAAVAMTPDSDLKSESFLETVRWFVAALPVNVKYGSWVMATHRTYTLPLWIVPRCHNACNRQIRYPLNATRCHAQSNT